LINLHVLADKYGVERLKTDTLNGLFMHLMPLNASPPYQHSICHAHEHLSDKSALLNFLVDILCSIQGKDWATYGIEGLPSPILLFVLERLAKGACGELDVLNKLKLCDYHEHKNKDERKACPHKYIVMN
jgi:hypothetical protein